MQLPLQGHDQIDQPIDTDFAPTNVFLELPHIHATFITDFPKSGSASFQRMDGYCERNMRVYNLRVDRNNNYTVGKAGLLVNNM